MVEWFRPSGAPATKRDRLVLVVLAATTIVMAAHYDYTAVAVGAGVVAALDLQVLILWACFVG